MTTFEAPPAQSGNRLLARLPARDYQRLLPSLHPVPLKFKQVLYEARAPMDYAYFPDQGTLSALTVMEDGDAIEVATVGNEGMAGLLLFLGAETSPLQVVVQIAGHAVRIEAEVLKKETARDGPMRRLLLAYHSAFLAQVSQSVACNGLHVINQRCCRWLLMTQDRVRSDEVALTHEYLAIMLGVRRASVTEVLQPLHDKGLIGTGRGKITILDRKGLEAAACECYRRVNEEYDRLLDGV